jgi:hypothetical protein
MLVDLKIHFILNKNKSEMLKAKYFSLKSKMPRKISFFSEVFNKNVIFNVLLMIILVLLPFLLSKSSGFQRSTPLPPPAPPQRALQGVGEKWIFSSSSRSFVHGYEAVRIRVKY